MWYVLNPYYLTETSELANSGGVDHKTADGDGGVY